MSELNPSSTRPEKLALNLKEASHALSLSPVTVKRLVRRGLLKPCKAVRHLIFSRRELERFLEST